MRFHLIFLSAFSLSLAMPGQETTNTNCTTNGNTTNCTTTNSNGAYQAGQAVGDALGKGIAAAIDSHTFSTKVKKYCAAHPGHTWQYHSGDDGHVISSGHCPTQEDMAVAAANAFMSKHKDYIAETSNSELLTAYIESHNLDPREEKSYERGYKDLKKAGQLHLYTR